MHQFLTFIFAIELYMLRAGFLSFIRSLVVYIHQKVYVKTGYADCLLAGS